LNRGSARSAEGKTSARRQGPLHAARLGAVCGCGTGGCGRPLKAHRSGHNDASLSILRKSGLTLSSELRGVAWGLHIARRRYRFDEPDGVSGRSRLESFSRVYVLARGSGR
jgi:hypothetical protein